MTADTLDTQIVVRLTSDLREALEVDAEAHGRTLAQSVRHHLKHALAGNGSSGGAPDRKEGERAAGDAVPSPDPDSTPPGAHVHKFKASKGASGNVVKRCGCGEVR